MLSVRVILHSQSHEELKKGCVRQQICCVVCLKCEKIYFTILRINYLLVTIGCSVLGAFDDDEIIHVEGDVDPTRDLDIIHEELMFKDMEYINKNLGNLERVVARGGDKTKKPEYVSLSLHMDEYLVRIYLMSVWSLGLLISKF